MKNRRITIFFTAALLLAGTPRVWQEAGNLLDFVQRKAQLKFFGMVMEPEAREAGETERVASLEPAAEIETALLKTNCPFEHIAPQAAEAPASSQPKRKTEPQSAKPTRRATDANDARLRSIARANSDRTETRLLHSPEIARNERTWTVGDVPSSFSRKAAPNALPAPHALKAEDFQVVYLPTISSAANALAEKESVIQFKALKKILDENKLQRQKGRVPVVRGFAPLPSS